MIDKNLLGNLFLDTFDDIVTEKWFSTVMHTPAYFTQIQIMACSNNNNKYLDICSLGKEGLETF